MNRGVSQLAQSNRPAVRRLHRRPAVAAPACRAVPGTRIAGAEVVTGLPHSAVREAGMLELLAAEMRIAELEAALAEAHAAAGTDPLTGALNRRGFAKAYQRELARMRRSGKGFSLAHLDLDDFKQLNDTQGHAAGDKALVHLVDLLGRLMRPSDILCRFGGEEFVVLLPDTEVDDAAAAIARYLREFSARPIPGTDCVMSFSAGVVGLRADESFDDLVARADAATYTAKRTGKKRIVAA
jgi:diguanylate cyclase